MENHMPVVGRRQSVKIAGTFPLVSTYKTKWKHASRPAGGTPIFFSFQARLCRLIATSI